MVRWPWTRGPVERLAPAVPAAAPGAVAADPAPSPMGWAFLPPLQRTLDTPIAPITRPTSFPGELPTWRSPVFTSTLSHAVVDTMPGGIVDGDGGGLGAPTHAVGPAPELTLLPPPRPTALQRSPAVPTSTEEHVAPVARAEQHRGAGESDVVRPDVPAPVLTRAPSLGMPVVHRSVVPEAPPLPSAEHPAEHPAAAADAETADPSATADSDADGPPDVGPAADLAGRPPLGSTTPGLPWLQRSAIPSEVGRPAVVQRSAAAPLAVPAPATPRLGLGPPLRQAPDTALTTPPEPYEPPPAPAPPPTAAVTAAVTGFTEVPIQRAPAVTTPPTPRPAPAGPQVRPPVDLPAAELTLARSVVPDAAELPPSPSVADPAAPAGEDGSTDGSPGVPQIRDAVDRPDAVAGVAPPALLPSAPLPLAGGIATSIQRAELLPGPGSPTPSLVVRPASLIPQKAARERVVPIQRLAVGETMAPPTPAANGPAQGRAAVQRSAPPYARAPDTPPPVPSPAPPLPEPPVPGVSLPDITVDTPATVGPDATPADLAARPAAVTPLSSPSPVVSRAVAPEHPVRPAPMVPNTAGRSTPPPLPAALPLAAAPTETVAVQAAAEAPTRGAEAGPATSAGGTLPEAGGGTAALGPDQVSVQTASAPPATPGGAAPGAGGAAGGASATGDVDALAQRLFPAVLRRIKAELLLDRERRGVRTDPW